MESLDPRPKPRNISEMSNEELLAEITAWAAIPLPEHRAEGRARRARGENKTSKPARRKSTFDALFSE